MNFPEYDLPMSEDLEGLRQPLAIGSKTAANRIAVQPMEGCDGTREGEPGELTVRRYMRFAEGGAALIWFEATAIEEDGRANPRQLMLNEATLPAFAKLVEDTKARCLDTNGFEPIMVLQATHSGRYAKPHGTPEPKIAYNSPIFEKDKPIDSSRIVSDDELRAMEERYETVARLAVLAGFDAVDVKACHRYLNSELLSAYERKGEYGGSYENRTRFFKNCVAAVRANVPHDFIVTSRMNIYDGFPYPYGLGVKPGEGIEPCLEEPIRLLGELGFELADITMGNPYFNPEVNRPVDIPAVERMYRLTGEVARALGGLKIISSAPTYMKELSPYLAAGAVKQGYCSMVGFGRMAFAYPDFARDILLDSYDKRRQCVCCGKCTALMRAGSTAGCVVRDPYYTKLYKEVCMK